MVCMGQSTIVKDEEWTTWCTWVPSTIAAINSMRLVCVLATATINLF